MSKIPSWKQELVAETSDKISKSKVSAIVSIKGIRNKQLQDIRFKLKGMASLKVMRGTLLVKAIERAGLKNGDKLIPSIRGQVALITTDENPNKLYKLVESTRQKAPARGGEISEEDIIVPAKETNFPPGPMIGEFQKVGLQAAIEKGKIVIKKESVFVKKGEKISRDKAKTLERLEIFPIEVGLDLISAYESGIIFDKDVLSLTPEKIISQIAGAFSQAKGVAKEAVFFVKEILPDYIVKATLEAENLAIAANYVDESNLKIFLVKAIREAMTLNNAILGEPKKQEEQKEEVKEEKKEEEDGTSGLNALFG